MNLIIKGKIKKTLIFPVVTGRISVLLCIRIVCCSGLVIFGQDHVDLLRACAEVLFCVLINLSDQISGKSCIDLNIVGTDSHVAPPLKSVKSILS